MDKKQISISHPVIWWLLTEGPNLEPYEQWVLDPKNKEFVDELKGMLHEPDHIRIDLSQFEEDEVPESV